MVELWRIQLEKVIDGHWIDPLLACSGLLNPLQQAVGVTPVALCLQHHFGQRRRLRHSLLSSCTSFTCSGAAGLLRVLTILGKQDNDLNQDGKIWPRKCGM